MRGKRDPDVILLPAAEVLALRADPRGGEPYALTVERSGRRVAWRLADGPPQRLGDLEGGAPWPAGRQVAIGPDGVLWSAALAPSRDRVEVTRHASPPTAWEVPCAAACADGALRVDAAESPAGRIVAGERVWTFGSGPVTEVAARTEAGHGDGPWRDGDRVGWGVGPGVALGSCAAAGPGHGAVVELGIDWAIDACGALQLVGEHGARLSVASGTVDGATWGGLLADAAPGIGEAGRLWWVSAGPSGARLSAWSPEDVFPVGWTSWELAAGAKRSLPAPAPLRTGLPARATYEVRLPEGAEIEAAVAGPRAVWLGGRVASPSGPNAVVLRVRDVR